MSKHKHESVAREFIDSTFDFSLMSDTATKLTVNDFTKCFLAGCDHVEKVNKEVSEKSFEETFKMLIADRIERGGALSVSVLSAHKQFVEKVWQIALEVGKKLGIDEALKEQGGGGDE